MIRQAKKTPAAETSTSPSKSLTNALPEPSNTSLPESEQHQNIAAEMFHLRKLESQTKDLAQAISNVRIAADGVESLNQDKLVAVLARCMVHGHDVHYLAGEGDLEVLRHIKISETLTGPLHAARDLILRSPASLECVLVFSNRLEAVYLSGRRETYSC